MATFKKNYLHSYVKVIIEGSFPDTSKDMAYCIIFRPLPVENLINVILLLKIKVTLSYGGTERISGPLVYSFTVIIKFLLVKKMMLFLF